MEKVDNYLVTEFSGPGVLPLSFDPETTLALPGTYTVEKLSNATIIKHSDGDDLPFHAFRFTCEGHVPVTFYGAYRAGDGAGGYLINDPPEPGVTVDDLDADDRACVRGESLST